MYALHQSSSGNFLNMKCKMKIKATFTNKLKSQKNIQNIKRKKKKKNSKKPRTLHILTSFNKQFK